MLQHLLVFIFVLCICAAVTIKLVGQQIDLMKVLAIITKARR